MESTTIKGWVLPPLSVGEMTLTALNSSSNSRRGRRGCVVFAIVDIVSTFQKVSTKLDQAHRAKGLALLHGCRGPHRPRRIDCSLVMLPVDRVLAQDGVAGRCGVGDSRPGSTARSILGFVI